MPTYKALKDGYHDGIYRNIGELFASDIKYDKLPSWLEKAKATDKTVTQKKFVREALIQETMREMLGEDLEQQNPEFWIGNGSPDIKELAKRTKLDDITSVERNALWGRMVRPTSGATDLGDRVKGADK